MPARTKPPADIDTIASAIPRVFEQVQATTANHQKNFIALYKLHADAATHTQSVQNARSIKLVGERAFEDSVLDMLTRVLPVKKGASVADRVIKFVAGYIKFINEKAAEETKDNGDDDETTASRFGSRIMRFLLSGCVAKDKNVRFRVLQCVAEMIAHLGEIDEDLYSVLRSSLMERARDKEPTIRVQAVAALSKLAGAEDIAELDDGEQSIMDLLIDCMRYDLSPDVRRMALLNLPLTPATLAPILARTRDTDPVVRKLVYSHILEPRTLTDAGEVGLTHPRALTIAQREAIVRNGLGDREDNVRAAAGRLMATWVDVARGAGLRVKKEEEGGEGVRGYVVDFLTLFDLVEGKIAEDALVSVFTVRADIFDNIGFEDEYWEALTPERTFLARVFVDHCVAQKDDARLETVLPVVTALAFRIQATYNELLARIQQDEEDRLLRSGMSGEDEDEERARREEERMDGEFVIGEMLRLAVNLDYADEIGRRKMFQLVRDMISHDVLPENLVARCLDVLRVLSPNERDLIRVVVEVVHELRDPSEPEEDNPQVNDGESELAKTPATVRVRPQGFGLPKPESEMTPDERARADAIDLRCLALCIGMLERVNGTFEENSTLEGILGELIIPAVKRKELLLRQRGLVSLGLCCLIARRMALNSFQLFLGQVQAAPEVLKTSVLHIVFDILMVHEGDFLGPGSANGDRIVTFLLHLLETEETDKVQALLCMGIAKLMLAGMITDERVLKTLVLVYVSPETADNQELRQCLAYFFPVYCYSSPQNQRRIQRIFIPLFEQLVGALREWSEDQEQDPITSAQLGLMFIDWTDPQKAVPVARGGREADDGVHVDMAADIVKALYNRDLEKDDKKALCQLLGKLYLPDVVDEDKIRSLKLLVQNLRSRRPLRDTASQNAFAKFDDALSKKYARQLEGFSEEEFRQLENLDAHAGVKDTFEFLDKIEPDDEDEDVKPARRTRKRRSGSIESTSRASNATSEMGSIPPSPRSKSRGKAKRRRLSESDDESDEEEDEGTPAPTAVPTRNVPKRSAAEKTRRAVKAAVTPVKIEESDEEEPEEEEDEKEDDEESTPVPRRRGKRAPTRDTTSPGSSVAPDHPSPDDVAQDLSMITVEDEDDADEVEDIL
ncbi:nuclear condensing complex subunit [Rhodofomes roseus]|uniref:Nuclear condensing complex subunit n=1 Tax=Rhodofomes roseus TaxID=34475 RepID=A0ABQ8KHT5_9APHY|nr:nuclear condensing complex subunit [Rhodofomes roseus]KAH9837531.1 nuclear condensing complex subunit [Rhodofomes roseus]